MLINELAMSYIGVKVLILTAPIFFLIDLIKLIKGIMLNIEEAYKLPEEAEEGKWMEYSDPEGYTDFSKLPEKDRPMLLLRSAKSDAYERERTRCMKKVRNVNNNSQVEKALIESMANAIIIDWKNIGGTKGKWECNRDNKQKALSNKVFREEVWSMASDLDNFRNNEE